MCVIKIGFLDFKKSKHSISGKNPAINCMNFFKPCCSFRYAIKSTKTSFFPIKTIKEYKASGYTVYFTGQYNTEGYYTFTDVI